MPLLVDRDSGKVILNKADIDYTDTANGLNATATQAGQLVKVTTDKDGNAASYVTFQVRTMQLLRHLWLIQVMIPLQTKQQQLRPTKLQLL
jgi:hypothetical protein